MIYPKDKLAQFIVYACEKNGVETVIISPGSRNAPLIIGFHNNPKIKCLSIVDERSAGFFALGIAQQTQNPVALVCTSGSALLNYYPAIAEAYFSHIPLLVLSADRPEYLLNIGDGQTINQKDVFRNHIIQSVNLSIQNIDAQYSFVSEAMQKAKTDKGPVHINIPFDEPLYETTTKATIFPTLNTEISTSLLDESPLDVDELAVFAEKWNNSTKKMVLIGVNFPSELMQIQINHLVKDPSVLVLTETTSNIYHTKIINGIDKLLAPLTQSEKENLQPEILLTFGGMIVSKKIKQFLREYSPKNHWHIDKYNSLDTYHVLTKHFAISIELFFSQFFFLTKKQQSTYQSDYIALKQHREIKQDAFLQTAPFSDLKAFESIINTIPKNYNVQLANSSIVRYAQLFNLDKSLCVFCNRGTSGIDGSTSTAIGAAHVVNNQTIFITGDISFLYDSNALWNNYIKNSFRIILINNGGGGIFRFIPGPSSTNVVEYFETPHRLTAKQLCEMHYFEYSTARNIDELKDALITFYKVENAPKLLEIFTPGIINEETLKRYFNFL